MISTGTPAPRPWIRLWARCVDYFLWGVIIYFPLVMAHRSGAISSPEYRLIATFPMLIVLTWALMEPIVMAVFGTTFGKALLSVRLTHPPSEGLSSANLGPLFKRSISVCLKGVGIGYLVATLVTGLFSYGDLKSHGETSWDRNGGFVVTHGKVGYLRGGAAAIICLVGTCFVLFWVILQIQH